MIPCKIYRTKLEKNRVLLTFFSKEMIVFAIQRDDILKIPESIEYGELIKRESISCFKILFQKIGGKRKEIIPAGIDFIYYDKNNYRVILHNIDRKDSFLKILLKKYL
jgi:hypothetical protein